MRSLTTFLVFMLAVTGFAQKSTLTLKDLAVPSSPAFILLDATPSMIQTPATPKAFILGIAQSFQSSGSDFPQDYSAEFTPYWWLNPSKRSIYSLAGFPDPATRRSRADTTLYEDPFSGLRFTTVSVGFLNKDMVPDPIDLSQKIVSAGFRSTILRIHKPGYAPGLNRLIENWHTEVQKEFDEYALLMAQVAIDSTKMNELLEKFTAAGSGSIARAIQEQINRKPLFSWDLGGAYATYGIGDSTWKTGRFGIWTTLSLYHNFRPAAGGSTDSYLNLGLSFRYLDDEYFRTENEPVRKQVLDAGGKIAYESGQFSIGFETVIRLLGKDDETQFRTVGLLNYKVADNIYLQASFGKNFDFPQKLIALFGVNWGFGKETIHL